MVNKPADEFYLENINIFFVILNFTGFTSTIDTEFEIMFLNALFS